MPFRNKKGPLGEGPLTGRGLGLCKGDRKNVNFTGFGESIRNGFQRGFGLGRGGSGFGFRAGRRSAGPRRGGGRIW